MKWAPTAALCLSTLLAVGSAQAMDAYDPESEAIKQDCMAYADLTSYLASAFGEVRSGNGELENGSSMELFVSPSGSWTMIELRGDGLGCVHASGNQLKLEMPKRPALADAPSWNRVGHFTLE